MIVHIKLNNVFIICSYQAVQCVDLSKPVINAQHACIYLAYSYKQTTLHNFCG